MRVNSNSKRRQSTNRAPALRRSIYSGRERLGDYQQHDDGEVVARGRRGEVLGRYRTVPQAIDAITMAAGRASCI